MFADSGTTPKPPFPCRASIFPEELPADRAVVRVEQVLSVGAAVAPAALLGHELGLQDFRRDEPSRPNRSNGHVDPSVVAE